MAQISRDSLLTLEAYSRQRKEFRARVIAHKKNRTLHLGAHITLIFEDELTMRYQIQEMLRIEKTFEEAGIQDELDAYNPLLVDNSCVGSEGTSDYRYVYSNSSVLACTASTRGDCCPQCPQSPVTANTTPVP